MQRTKMLYRFLCLVVFLLSGQILTAQQKAPDTVHLKDGTVVQGWIEHYETDRTLRIRISASRWEFIDHDDIERVVSRVEAEDAEPIQAQPLPDEPFTIRRDLDIVYLKNGEAYGGVIQEYERGSYLKLLSAKDETLVFADGEVERIIYGGRRKSRKNRRQNRFFEQGRKEYAFQETGYFQAFVMSFSLGQEKTDPRQPDFFFEDEREFNTIAGYGFHMTFGHQFNRLLGAGLTLGFDAYNLNTRENIVSLAAQYRGYFMKKRISPMGLLDIGYGLGLRNKQRGITQASGGLLVHPAVGLRFGGSSSHNFMVDLGMRMQEASFTRIIRSNNSTQIKNTTYYRWVFRLGMVF